MKTVFTNTFNRTFIINIKQTEQLIKMLVLLLLHLIDATANYLVAKMSLTLSHLYSALFWNLYIPWTKRTAQCMRHTSLIVLHVKCQHLCLQTLFSTISFEEQSALGYSLSSWVRPLCDFRILNLPITLCEVTD